MRIRVLVPNDVAFAHDLSLERLPLPPDVTLEESWLPRGPQVVESQTDQAMAAAGIAALALQAQDEGGDAVVITCGDDPGLAAARELVQIPVVGAGQAGLHMASLLGNRFSIIGTSERDRPGFEQLALNYRLETRLVSVRYVPVAVADLRDPSDKISDAYLDQVAAAADDGADVIIPGCTLFRRFTARARLEVGEKRGLSIIDPLISAVLLAELLVRSEISHAPHAHPPIDRRDELAAYLSRQ